MPFPCRPGKAHFDRAAAHAAVLDIADALRAGVFADFDHPAYYNLPWMKLLLEVEDRIKRTGPIV